MAGKYKNANNLYINKLCNSSRIFRCIRNEGKGFFLGIKLSEALPLSKVEGKLANEQSFQRVYKGKAIYWKIPKLSFIHTSSPLHLVNKIILPFFFFFQNTKNTPKMSPIFNFPRKSSFPTASLLGVKPKDQCERASIHQSIHNKLISTNIVSRRRENCVSVDKTLQILHSDWVKSLLAIKFAKWSLKRVFTHSLAAVVRV